MSSKLNKGGRDSLKEENTRLKERITDLAKAITKETAKRQTAQASKAASVKIHKVKTLSYQAKIKELQQENNIFASHIRDLEVSQERLESTLSDTSSRLNAHIEALQKLKKQLQDEKELNKVFNNLSFGERLAFLFTNKF